MDRETFIKQTMGVALTPGNLKELESLTSKVVRNVYGTWSSVESIEKDRYRVGRQEAGPEIPRPSAILCLSVHCLTRVTASTPPDAGRSPF